MDNYKLRLYKAAAEASQGRISCLDALPLCGYISGNHEQSGCLTDKESVRIHSCERGNYCSALRRSKVVWITPVLYRTASSIIREKGVGGGGGDLTPKHELAFSDATSAAEWFRFCNKEIKNSDVRSKTIILIQRLIESRNKALILSDHELLLDQNPESSFTAFLAKISSCAVATASSQSLKNAIVAGDLEVIAGNPSEELRSSEIVCGFICQRTFLNLFSQYFPYSRHSSYEELCDLIRAFKPKDIHPCTVDEEAWTPDSSIERLFGSLCSSDSFDHDQTMVALWKTRPCKDSQIQHSMSVEERPSDVDVDEAPPSQLVEVGGSNDHPHDSQPATLGGVAVEQQDMGNASSPRKKPRLSANIVQGNVSETFDSHCGDTDDSDDSSFYERVMKIKQLYDAGPQAEESEPVPIASEVLAVISRPSYSQIKVLGSLDVATPASDLTAAIPSHSQASAVTTRHDKKSGNENAVGNADSARIRTGVPSSPCPEHGAGGTQVSLGSNAFLSSPSSAQTGQHLNTREATIQRRKRAFEAANGDGSTDWASISDGLRCVRDHHTTPEAELG